MASALNLPPMPATEFRCTVQSFKMLTPTVFEIKFDTDKPFEYQAGQFVSVVVPGAGPNGRDLRRAYSIASSPEAKQVELCVKLVEGGPGTNYLYTLRPGDSFRGFAPYGDFVYEPKPGRHAVFIATGTGIAPFRGMVLSKHFKENAPASATLLLGVRFEDELLYTEELWNLPGVKFAEMVSRPTSAFTGRKGRVTDYLRDLPADFPWLETEFYLCGAGEMITEAKGILTEKGVQKDSIHTEVYYKTTTTAEE